MKKLVVVAMMLFPSVCFATGPWGDGILKDILYETQAVEHHLHSNEIWFGRHATQAANNWALRDTLGTFQLTAGTSMAYGDTMKIIGSSDTPCVAGNKFFDLHRVLLVSASSDSLYSARIIYGTTDASHAVAAGQYSTIFFRSDSANPQETEAWPVDVQSIRHATGTKVWMQIKSVVNSATVRFLVGIHEYPE